MMKKMFKKFFALVLAVIMMLSAAPLSMLTDIDIGKVFYSTASAAAEYSGVSLDVPWFSMIHKSGCGISSIAMVEAYEKGYDKNDSVAYNAVYNYNGKKVFLESYAKLGYSLKTNSLDAIYKELTKGNPVIVYRTGGSQGNHYSVIYEYSGSSSKLEKSGFKVLNTYRTNDYKPTDSVSIKNLSTWLGDSKWTHTLVRTANKITLTDLTTPEGKTFKYLTRQVGLNSAAAVGFMANIKAESNFNPKSKYDEGGFFSYGICQWNRGRKANLDSLCKSNGLKSDSLEGQLAFIKYELEHNYKKTVLNSLKDVTNDLNGAKKAAEIVCRKYEIPANIDAQVKKRQGYAESFWKTYGTGVANKASVATPTISTTSYYGGVEVKLASSTKDATIYYTTNGSTPTTGSKKYTGAFKLTSTATVKAIAVKASMSNSSVKSSKITVGTVSKPEISFSQAISYTNVTITSSTRDCVIYYTKDGSNPTVSSQKYEGVFAVDKNLTIKAIAVKKGCSNSSVAGKTLAVEKPEKPVLRIEGNKRVASNAIVNVLWNNVASATNYTVSLSDKNSTLISQTKTSDFGVNFDVKEMALPIGEYEVSVVAENYVGSSEEAKISFTVEADVTVKFLSDGKEILNQKVPYGGSASFPIAPQKKGYDFKKWSVAASKLINITEDLTVEAVFEPKVFEVILVYNGDSHSQRVEYGKAVVLPDNVKLPTQDYRIETWSVERTTGGYDINFVDGNMTIKPVFSLINPNLPITINEFSATYNSTEDAYDFKVKFTNGTDKAVSNTALIAVLKTSKGKTVATEKLDLANIAASDCITKEIAVNSSVNASQAEIYMVSYIDGVTGCALSNVRTAEVKAENGISYSEWSEFSTEKPEEKSGRTIIEKEQYSYRDKETTTSTSASLSGWTNTGSSVSYGSWGSWSSWSTKKQTGSSTKEVQTRKVYHYMHYCNGSGGIAPSAKYDNGKYGPHEIFSTTKYNNDRYSSATGYYIADGHKKCEKGMSSYYYMGTKTQYRYRTRSVVNIYSFERWGEASPWSDEVVQSTSTREVSTRRVYSFRDMINTGNDLIVEGENNSGIEMSVNGKITTESDYSGKTATIMVYKTVNADALEDQIMAIGQIKIGQDNSYEYSFIPKEELSEKTGDFVVAISVEGAQKRINVATIEVPAKTYTVDFVMKNNDGSFSKETVTVKEGEDATPPENVTELTGYTFSGWDKRFTNVTTNITVNAEYEAERVTVVFVDWENQKIVDINTNDYRYGDKLVLPQETLSTEGKIFKGWSCDEDTVVLGNTVVEAVFESIEYSVTFLDADGNVHSTQTVPHGYSAELPEAVEKEGYVFLGWSNDTMWWNVKENLSVSPIMTYSEKSEVVQSDTEEGNYLNGVLVGLDTSSEDERIFYTLDGSDPEIDISDNGEVKCGEATFEFLPEEDGFIWSTETINIKAQSYQAGEALSECTEFSYVVENEEIEDLNIASVSYSEPAEYYKITDTTASICMVINNPYADEVVGYGYSICNVATNESYGYDNCFEDGNNQKTVGKVFSITGLTPNTKYTYKFYATINGDSYESAEGSFTTTGSGALGKTEKIVSAQSNSAIKLTWSSVDNADGYRVFYKTASGWKALGNTTKTTVTFTNLAAGSRYTFAIMAGQIVDGKVVWSNTYSTIEAATKTVAPEKVISAQNTSALRLTWSACKGATGYRIYYKTGNVWKVCLNTTTATTHTFQGLKAGSKYTFAIRPYIKTVSGVIWSDYTQFIAATKPSEVTAKAASVGSGKITLTWNAVNGSDGYQVYYKIGNGDYRLFKTYSAVQNLTFSGLKSGVKYTFAVRAGIRTSGGNIFGGFKTSTVTVK